MWYPSSLRVLFALSNRVCSCRKRLVPGSAMYRPKTGGRKQEAQSCAATFSLHNKFPNLIYQKLRKTAISVSPAMSCMELFSSIPFQHFVIIYLQAVFTDFSFCLRCSWHLESCFWVHRVCSCHTESFLRELEGYLKVTAVFEKSREQTKIGARVHRQYQWQINCCYPKRLCLYFHCHSPVIWTSIVWIPSVE